MHDHHREVHDGAGFLNRRYAMIRTKVAIGVRVDQPELPDQRLHPVVGRVIRLSDASIFVKQRSAYQRWSSWWR